MCKTQFMLSGGGSANCHTFIPLGPSRPYGQQKGSYSSRHRTSCTRACFKSLKPAPTWAHLKLDAYPIRRGAFIRCNLSKSVLFFRHWNRKYGRMRSISWNAARILVRIGQPLLWGPQRLRPIIETRTRRWLPCLPREVGLVGHSAMLSRIEGGLKCHEREDGFLLSREYQSTDLRRLSIWI